MGRIEGKEEKKQSPDPNMMAEAVGRSENGNFQI
jgi:hypothetical protein